MFYLSGNVEELGRVQRVGGGGSSEGSAVQEGPECSARAN